jgi:hypothetical protein
MDEREKEIRRRLRDDFEHFASKALLIRTKSGAVLPFVMNEAQRYLHQQLEQQLATKGRIRALVLKGRQQGCSTYVGGRYFWKTSHRQGRQAFILTHQAESTDLLFEMTKRYLENVPALVRPSTSAINGKAIAFDKLDSGYKVGTAGSKGAGRGATIQYFHGSEVAFWPNAETHVRGVLQAVPNEPGTEVILESTSDGPLGLFYELCKQAHEGQGEYILVFIPWFWQSEYREAIAPDFTPTSDEREYAEAYGLDLEQISWRRAKIIELWGVENFRREYPATVEEAFEADAKGALWCRDNINTLRVVKAPCEMVRIVVAVDPSATSGKNSAEAGIMVGGLGTDGKGYLLEDISIKASPAVWGAAAVDAYHRWSADRLVAEVNNGGEMVETVIRTADPDHVVAYKQLHASRGKVTRAEPIAAFYEQARIHHVGQFVALENQQCTWVPGMPSPDRMDALVWLFTELMIEGGAPGVFIVDQL